MRSYRTGIILGLAALALAVRVAPYIFARFGLLNVQDFLASLLSIAPIGAMCLFGGARVANRWVGVGVPLAVLIGSNLLIGLVMGDFEFYTFFRDQGVVVCAFLVMALLGATIREGASAARIAGTAFVAELAFFLITNFAFWALMDWYPKTAAGLWQSYVMALPFFGRSLAGMTFWGALQFGGLAYLERSERTSTTTESV